MGRCSFYAVKCHIGVGVTVTATLLQHWSSSKQCWTEKTSCRKISTVYLLCKVYKRGKYSYFLWIHTNRSSIRTCRGLINTKQGLRFFLSEESQQSCLGRQLRPLHVFLCEEKGRGLKFDRTGWGRKAVCCLPKFLYVYRFTVTSERKSSVDRCPVTLLVTCKLACSFRRADGLFPDVTQRRAF